MNTKLTLISSIVAGAMLVGGPAMAQTDFLEGWSGSASLGAVLSAGNSDTRNITGSVNVKKQVDLWSHTAFGSTYSAENNDVETANRFDIGYKIERNFNERLYGFARARYDEDDFGNIDNRYSIVVGGGYNIFNDGKQSLNGELGVGFTDTRFLSLTPVVNLDPTAIDPATGVLIPVGEELPGQENLDSLNADGAILYGGLTYSNRLTDTISFNSVFNFEASDDNTYTIWDNSLTISVASNISIGLGLLSRNNTDIVGPLGENTDTVTRFNIVFGI